MTNLRLDTDSPILQTRLATAADLPALVSIHKRAYSCRHFTALLPDHTLSAYYRCFLSDGAEISLATYCDNILGFAVYGLSIPARIATFKRAASRDIFITSIRHPATAARKFLTALQARLSSQHAPLPADFLLLSIAVAQPGRGVGTHLLRQLAVTAKSRQQSSVGLYVNVDNTHAINVYLASGFVIRHYHCGQFYMEKNLEL
jgi:ribosomal protein S18 acetylase RimI-like enzyme